MNYEHLSTYTLKESDAELSLHTVPMEKKKKQNGLTGQEGSTTYCCVSVVNLFARIAFEYLKMLEWLWQFCLPSTPDFVTYVDIYLQEKKDAIRFVSSKNKYKYKLHT